jgi:ribose/xylose/arabinose/galactoside ABC-type transport system permease subunit
MRRLSRHDPAAGSPPPIEVVIRVGDGRVGDWQLRRSLGSIINWAIIQKITCIALWYVMDFTAIGRRLLFVGRSPQVARLTGIKVEKVQRNALISAGRRGPRSTAK